MSDISVDAALGEGFGLIRRQPLSVVAWGAVLTGLQVATFALFAPYYLSVYGAMLGVIAHGGAGPLMALSGPNARQMQSLQQLFSLVQLFVAMVVYCAAFRAVLHPERSSFAYLRVGLPELFLAVLTFAGVVALVIALVVVTIPVAIIIGITVAATHGASAAALVLIPILLLAMLILVLVVGVRFALVGPMVVQDGQFHLFESWTLTRGRIGSLLLITLGLFGMLLVIDSVLLAIFIGLVAVVVNGIGGPSQALVLLHASPQALLGKLAPVLVLLVIIEVPLRGCLVAIAGAPWARAYRDLVPDESGTFD
jgi:hypothetical protein